MELKVPLLNSSAGHDVNPISRDAISFSTLSPVIFKLLHFQLTLLCDYKALVLEKYPTVEIGKYLLYHG